MEADKTIRTDVLILGAGPAGMAAAFELHKARKSMIILEKNNAVGGLSRTLECGEFRTDIGPHRFFSQNKYLYDFIEDLLGERWIKVNRLTRFYIENKFFLYPIELKDALINVGFRKALKILFDYAAQRIKKMFIRREPVNFEEKTVSDFGKTLAELNMLSYTEKIWGLPCSEISVDWSKQRIKGLSIMELLKNTLMKSKNAPKTLVDRFYYPDEGTSAIYEEMKRNVLMGGETVKLNSYPSGVSHDGSRVADVRAEIDGEKYVIKPNYVLSSIPITELISLLDPLAPSDVLEAAKRLKFRSHLSLFITVNKPSIFKDQWIYFPDKKIPFGRIMEPKNFSGRMSPPGKTSLLIEFFCWENDALWNAGKEELFNMSIGWLEKLNFLKKEEVIDIFLHKEKYAYPVYDLNYKNNVRIVKEYLGKIGNLQLIGRGGSFRYNNQDHALEMGILAARSIIEGRQYNIEEVGAEQKYFERGYVK